MTIPQELNDRLLMLFDIAGLPEHQQKSLTERAKQMYFNIFSTLSNEVNSKQIEEKIALIQYEYDEIFNALYYLHNIDSKLAIRPMLINSIIKTHIGRYGLYLTIQSKHHCCINYESIGQLADKTFILKQIAGIEGFEHIAEQLTMMIMAGDNVPNT